MESFRFEVGARHAAPLRQRLDVYLVHALEGRVPRGRIKEALDRGLVTVNGRAAKPSAWVREGDEIAGEIPDVPSRAPCPEVLPVRVVHEDADLLVVDKPAGQVVHPGAGHFRGTLVSALMGRAGTTLSDLGGPDRPGIVHRLDKDTSGLILVAKNNRAHRALAEQFQTRSLAKTYLALVRGRPEFDQGSVDRPLGRHPKIKEKMAVSDRDTAREALTRYRVKERYKYAALLEVKPVTGRTHQIRVHLASIGHPIVGDLLYAVRHQSAGGQGAEAPRMGLHAWRIELAHPKSGKLMKFEAPLPEDFQKMIDEAKKAK